MEVTPNAQELGNKEIRSLSSVELRVCVCMCDVVCDVRCLLA